MGLAIPFPNAFTSNTLNGAFYPLTISAYENQGALGLDISPQRVVDMSDLLTAYEAITVFGVEQSSVHDSKGRRPLSISEIAAEDYINNREIDAETIVVTPANLKRLLAGFFPSKLQAFSLPAIASEDEIITAVFACIDYEWKPKTNILPSVANGTLYINTTEDCRMHVETYDPELLKAAIGRIVRIYTGTVIAQAAGAQTADIAEFTPDFLDWFWTLATGLTIIRDHTAADVGTARIGLIAREVDATQALGMKADFTLTYSVDQGAWYAE
jgi:hypothetical protein